MKIPQQRVDTLSSTYLLTSLPATIYSRHTEQSPMYLKTSRTCHSRHIVSLVLTIFTDVRHRLQQRADTPSPLYLPSLLTSHTGYSRHCLPCTYHPNWCQAQATAESRHTVSLVLTILTDVMQRVDTLSPLSLLMSRSGHSRVDTLSPLYLPSLLTSHTGHSRHCLPCTYHPYWCHALATTESRHIVSLVLTILTDVTLLMSCTGHNRE